MDGQTDRQASTWRYATIYAAYKRFGVELHGSGAERRLAPGNPKALAFIPPCKRTSMLEAPFFSLPKTALIRRNPGLIVKQFADGDQLPQILAA